MIDLAPGQNHIVIRRGKTEFYNEGIFHLSQTYNTHVPVFISDLLGRIDTDQIYGKNVRDLIMINNHPIVKVRVFGKILAEYHKTLKSGSGFHVLTIDDCSGADSMICIRIDHEIYLQAGLKMDENHGRLIEIMGRTNIYRKRLEIVCDTLRMVEPSNLNISVGKRIHHELGLWKERWDFRISVLQRPWKHVTEELPPKGANVFRLDYRDELRKRARQNIELDHYEVPSLLRQDSLEIIQIREAKGFSKISRSSGTFSDIFDSTAVESSSRQASFSEAPSQGPTRIISGTPEANQTSKSSGCEGIGPSSDPLNQKENMHRSHPRKQRKEQNSSQPLSQSQTSNAYHGIKLQTRFNEDSIFNTPPKPIAPGLPLKLTNEFRLSVEFIKWIVKNEFRVFQLSQLFNDLNISFLLDCLTTSLNALSFPKTDPIYSKPFHEQRLILFHRIRHGLTSSRLISITKSQKVKSKNLEVLYNHLRKCLNVMKSSFLQLRETKILDVSNYADTIKNMNIIAGDINLKLINEIIEMILVQDFGDRKRWKYDLELTRWTYS